jgi:hypothetical protein
MFALRIALLSNQLRGLVAREGATPAPPAGRGAIRPDHSTGGAVTAAGGFFGGAAALNVADHAPSATPASWLRSAEETAAGLTSPGTGAER